MAELNEKQREVIHSTWITLSSITQAYGEYSVLSKMCKTRMHELETVFPSVRNLAEAVRRTHRG